MKWTPEKVKEVVLECRQAGKIASEKQLAKLRGEGDKWIVSDGFTGREVGRMLDLCGGAWVVINAKQGFYRVAKKVAEDRHLRFSCGRNYGGGGMFSVYDTNNRQEMSVNEASANAVADTLRKHGVKVEYIKTYID
jgi:hypothetical protein